MLETSSALVEQGHARGVAPAGAVHARARVRIRRAQVETAYGGAIAEVREHRPEEELMADVGGAAGDVAADEVLVHGLEVRRGEEGARQDAAAEARGQAL